MAKFGITGDDFGTEIPETQVPEQDLTDERRKAKYSKSAEFKRIRQSFYDRIDYYQKFLPDGRSVVTAGASERADAWAVANLLIMELKIIIGDYENSAEAVKEADKK